MGTIKPSLGLDVSFLRKLKVLSEFDEESIGYFLGHAHIKRYSKGKLLFLQGDDVKTFYIVRSGWIKLFRNIEDGTEVITDLCKEGDLFSKSAMIDGTTHPTCGQVVEEAIIYEIPARILRDSIKSNLKMALNMISYLSNSINSLDRQVEHLSIMNADQRVGCFLLNLCTSTKESRVRVKLPCNKELIANYLGMKPETFSRALAKLKKIGVTSGPDYIEINDIWVLHRYTCSSCSCEGNCLSRPQISSDRSDALVCSMSVDSQSNYTLPM